MNEIWKPVPGYEEYYEASNLGRIRSKDRIVEYEKNYSGKIVKAEHHFRSKVLKPGSGGGYLTVIFSVDGKSKDKLVHRVIAETFIPNPDNKLQVDHIDGDKTNNCIDNLRWVTPSENQQHSIEIGTHTVCNPYRKVPVRCVDDGNCFDSMADAEEFYNIPKGRISVAIKSNQRVYGHLFEVRSRSKRLF